MSHKTCTCKAGTLETSEHGSAIHAPLHWRRDHSCAAASGLIACYTFAVPGSKGAEGRGAQAPDCFNARRTSEAHWRASEWPGRFSSSARSSRRDYAAGHCGGVHRGPGTAQRGTWPGGSTCAPQTEISSGVEGAGTGSGPAEVGCSGSTGQVRKISKQEYHQPPRQFSSSVPGCPRCMESVPAAFSEPGGPRKRARQPGGCLDHAVSDWTQIDALPEQLRDHGGWGGAKGRNIGHRSSPGPEGSWAGLGVLRGVQLGPWTAGFGGR
jgi:hypothetical protein